MTERKSRAKPKVEAPRGRGVRSVSEMLPEVGGAAFRRFGFVQSAVVSRWGEIVGPRYAGITAPEAIRFPHGQKQGGELVLVAHGAHATIMQHVTPAIMERVNRFFGYPAVARVTIRQGQVAPPQPARVTPEPKPLSAEMGESLRGIGDPELRACLEALAGAVAASSGPPRIGGGVRRGTAE